MVIKSRIRKGSFQDALRLMRISKIIRDSEGVTNAVVVMATEKAKFAIQDAGLMLPEIKEAAGNDLVMVVQAKSEEVANQTLDDVENLISAGGSTELKSESSDNLNVEIKAINIGLEIFRDALVDQGVKVKHVNWKVPAKGDMKLINLLKKMY
ncbi:hypothetical protein MYX76_06470 [Desulfobacterota bacterium AH_259_B03_O07]|nr:hypothetical protein [Desulfobacterota bacterium AH_259_B03_O07]